MGLLGHSTRNIGTGLEERNAFTDTNQCGSTREGNEGLLHLSQSLPDSNPLTNEPEQSTKIVCGLFFPREFLNLKNISSDYKTTTVKEKQVIKTPENG